MFQTKHLTTSVEYKDDTETGSVVARFSTFNIVDREGDIVRASAFTDGQEVPMVWAHQWDKPVGKGTIRVLKDHARFEGTFFPTAAGQEARETVKAMGALQQYSWGFRVTDTQANDKIRGLDITAAEVFEVSPVLVGANQHTETLAIKSAPLTKDAMTEMRAQMGRMRAAMDAMEETMAGMEEMDDGKADAADADEKQITDAKNAPLLDAKKRLALEELALEAIAIG